ncbi:hypothetical protein [Mesorhizobium escarrei]|uniref:Uncharacterized protein n=1 Tax=Mesorhizobium escarrei TaxID=666018 RepID=A0ABM9DSE3_9HYPH|nr:hypothetical protein [Mesorhizobium escarrei]CAH2399618.1 hypothetical protein MES5069_230036 [Mesorhizobium escarrei]
MNILDQLKLFDWLQKHDLLERGMDLLDQQAAFSIYTELADPEDGDPQAAAAYIKRLQQRPKAIGAL